MSELKKIVESCHAEYTVTEAKFNGLIIALRKSCQHKETKWLQLFDKYGCEVSQNFHKRCTICGKIIEQYSSSPETMAKIEALRSEIEVIIDDAARIEKDNQTPT